MRNMLAALLALFLIAFDLGGQARRFPFRQGSPSLPPNITNWTAQIDEQAPPTLAVGGCFTNAHGNQVCRASGPATLPSGLGVAHWYVDRSPFSFDDRCIVNNSTTVLIPMDPVTGVPGTNVKTVPTVSGGWTIGSSQHYWHPNATHPRRLYAGFSTARGARLYYLDVAEDCTPGSWTMLKDFTSAINYDSPALSALTSEQKDLLFPNLMATNGDKFLFDFRLQSKDARGIIQYQITGDVLRVDLGNVATNVVGSFPSGLFLGGVLVAPRSMTHVALQWDTPSPPSNARGTQKPWGTNPLDGATVMFDPTAIIGHGSGIAGGYTTYINTNDIVGPLCGGNNNYLGKILRTTTSDVTTYAEAMAMEFCWNMRGIHLSSNMPNNWTIASVYQESALTGRMTGPAPMHEIFAFRDDQTIAYTTGTSGTFSNRGPIVRISHNWTCPYCAGQAPYWGQPHGSVSISSKFLAFSSTWCRTDAECASNGGRYDIYVLKMPTLAP